MKKLIVAAAVSALAVCLVPSFVGQAQAAPAKNPLCALAKQEKNPVAWNAFYGCLGKPARLQHAAVRSRGAAPQSEFCNMAKQEKDMVGWSQFYGCWHH